jgi:pimeloyl-ACP methyl ester carboxylesterase
MRIRRSLVALATTGLLVTTGAAAVARADGGPKSHGPRPTIVLVHGAFADGSSWNGEVSRLQRLGFTVVAPPNELRGLAQDSTYLASFLKSLSGPVVLAGHSYGGAVISQAAAGNPQVKALVFVNALMPDAGENLGALAAKFPGAELPDALKPVPFANADGSTGVDLFVDPARFRAVFAADVPARQSALMAAEQRPLAASVFGGTASAAAWRTIPSWAVIGRQDKAIAPDLERFEAQRAHSHAVEINSSHVSLVSHPDVVTAVILAAARATGGR